MHRAMGFGQRRCKLTVEGCWARVKGEEIESGAVGTEGERRRSQRSQAQAHSALPFAPGGAGDGDEQEASALAEGEAEHKRSFDGPNSRRRSEQQLQSRLHAGEGLYVGTRDRMAFIWSAPAWHLEKR